MNEYWYQKAKRLLREKKISHTKVGKRLGVEKAAVSLRLNGKARSSAEDMIIIADMLDISIDELCADDPTHITNVQDKSFIRKLRSMSEQEASKLEEVLKYLSENSHK